MGLESPHSGACLAAVKSRVCALPEGVAAGHVLGAGLLGGIGFTMSIFITNLAFAQSPAAINTSKLAILIASLLAGVLGFLWLRSANRQWRPGTSADKRRQN